MVQCPYIYHGCHTSTEQAYFLALYFLTASIFADRIAREKKWPKNVADLNLETSEQVDILNLKRKFLPCPCNGRLKYQDHSMFVLLLATRFSIQNIISIISTSQHFMTVIDNIISSALKTCLIYPQR